MGSDFFPENQARIKIPLGLLQRGVKKKIVEDFIEEGGDFFTGNVSGWLESNLNMLARKEFDDVA